MRKRFFSIGVPVVVIAALVVAYLLLRSSAPAEAQATDPPADNEPVTEPADPNPTIEPGPTPHDPFNAYPADEGAVTWDDMAVDEQAAVQATQEWAETAHGADVHNAFAAAAATTSNLREIEEAQSASGLDGIETLGVVP